MPGNNGYVMPSYNDLVNFWNQGHQPQQNQTQMLPAGTMLWADLDQAAKFQPMGKEPIALFINGRSEIHVKSYDKMGQPITTILDYKERPQNPQNVFATQQDILQLNSRLDALIAALSGNNQQQEAMTHEQSV